jgi:hypothetical protein
MAGSGKGFVRTMFADPNAVADYIPVDICIQFMLLAAWCKAAGRYFTPLLLYFYQRFHFQSRYTIKKTVINFVISVRLSVSQSARNKTAALGGLLWNLILEEFGETCRKNSNLPKILEEEE